MAPASFHFDTFDAQITGEPSVLEVLGRTHSRLVRWDLFPAEETPGMIGPDLAAAWEQPESAQLLLHLDPVARWHNREPLNGRPVTAEEIRLSLERTLALAAAAGLPQIRRAWEWLTIDQVDSPDGSTLVIRTAAPDPFLLETLAGAFAQVQAPAVIDGLRAGLDGLDPAAVVGSGPFVLEGMEDGRLVFRAFRGGHLAPAIDGIQISEPRSRLDPQVLADHDEVILRDRRDAAMF
jgi:peptide/nickel transport system substrate-binding protein